MSELRKQLDIARSRYQAARYPGDLAADLLGRRSRGWGPQLVAAGALAAVVAIALYLLTASKPNGETPITRDTPNPDSTTAIDELAEVDFSLGTVPEVRFADVVNNVELVPPSYDMSFAVPTLSFGVSEESETMTTSQESV